MPTITDPLEGAICATMVNPKQLIFKNTAQKPIILTGFYAKLTNCIPPTEEPVVIGIVIKGKKRVEQITIPRYPFPSNQYIRPNGHHGPPLDIGNKL